MHIRLARLALSLVVLCLVGAAAMGQDYYVNDSSTTNDAWCTAPGSDGNSGLTPATPKASFHALIDMNDLEPGDAVHIDTGSYVLSAAVEITEEDQGSAAAPVTFEASPYGVTIGWASPSQNPSTWILNHCDYVVVTTATSNAHPGVPQRWARFEGGYAGLFLSGALHCTLSRIECTGNTRHGITASGSDDLRCTNALVHGNANGIALEYCDTALIEHITSADNTWNQLHMRACTDVTLRNNILHASEANATVLHLDDTDVAFASDYNNIHAANGALLCNRGDAIGAWRAASGQDAHSVSRPPLFVDAASGDYHLQSTAGSYHDGAWTADGADCLCIDTGLGDVGAEPTPNTSALHGAARGRRNLGAYGGTEQASKTPATRHLVIHEPDGGEKYVDKSVPVAVRWTWTGTGWTAGDTLAWTFSSDGAATWTAIPGASAASVDSGTFAWNISAAPDSAQCRVSAVCNQAAAITDQSQRNFRIGGTSFDYYVNDASTTNDAWCMAPGDDANDGLAPTAPKASVAAVLAAYSLAPGDVVHIDTGVYILASNIRVTSDDDGASAAPVTFEASPYGVTTSHTGISYASTWHMSRCQYVTLTTATSSAHPAAAQRWMRTANGGYGVFVDYASHCVVRRLDILSSTAGIRADHGQHNQYINNLVHCRSDGFDFTSPDNATIEGNTVSGNSRYQIYMISNTGATTVRNNILWADGATGVAFEWAGSATSMNSDYNSLCATNGAVVSNRGDTLSAWQSATGQDAHSTDQPPLFVGGVPIYDYHLQSAAGSYHDGAWTADSATSLYIDHGFGDAGDEPTPNATAGRGPDGGQRNLGAYGGTEQGSKTPAGRHIVLLKPIGGEAYTDRSIPIDVRWEWLGAAWALGDTLAFEYSDDSGATWSPIPAAGAVPFEAGTFAWDVSSLDAGVQYRLRVTCNQEPAATAQNDRNFQIGPNLYYYVNDASTTNDAWCSAPGDNANDGITPATPKATVQNVINTYNLEPGATVCVDTGQYTLTSPITLGASDAGDDTARVTFLGSPHPDGAVLSGDGVVDGFRLGECSYVEISGFYIRQTDNAVTLSDSHHCIVSHCRLTDSNRGIHITDGSDDGTFRNNILAGNSRGIAVEYDFTTVRYENHTIEQNTFVGNFVGFDVDGTAVGLVVRNNIFQQDEGPCLGVYMYLTDCDYNLFHTTGTAYVYTGYETAYTLATWQAVTGFDRNSVSCDPLFVDAASGDYHLQSTAGSYHDGAWTADGATSPAIDIGWGDVGDEPVPNASAHHAPGTGQRNLGAYGGTAQASKTPATRLLCLDHPIGGETFPAFGLPVEIRWQRTGLAWQASDTVALDYSDDSGATWSPITTGVPVADGAYLWDISALPAGTQYRVRATCEQDPTATAASVDDFAIGQGQTYYVNDASTIHDAWCTAPGDDANDGLSPATPKATVQAIIDTHDLEPGDTVLIDTGTYTLGSNITVTGDDRGADTAHVTFAASPYGVIIDRVDAWNGCYAWHFDDCSYVHLTTAHSNRHPGVPQRWMRITGAYNGVHGTSSGAILMTRLELSNNAYSGLFFESSGISRCSHILAHHNSIGIALDGLANNVIENCTSVLNSMGQFRAGDTTYVRPLLRNNIFWADGENSYITVMPIYLDWFRSDYNDFHVTNGAAVESEPSDRSIDFEEWKNWTGQDAHSVSVPPRFVDPDNGDYHLQSTAGSYHDGAWTPDGSNSPCIDRGFGDAGDEPLP
ncbi:right-handed parallel beta-helix repeat-containing protein, partial [bacterium]|nr:right-handed parallel beta-helix repeat-containing protein [bacterium]